MTIAGLVSLVRGTEITEGFVSDVCPLIRGTRVTVRTVLASLAEGGTINEILEDFPSLNEKHVRAIIAFAAASAEEDLPLPEIPKVA